MIGIVKKNGIMMVDFALAAERQQGLTPEQSIYQACMLRFRPIMMTTMAALLGALPLAIGTGTGSELRRPLGIAVLGGLLVSQFLTLYATPVVYLAFARLERRFQAQIASGAGAQHHPARTRRSEARRGHRGMNFSEPFVRRPVATTLLTLAVGLLGIIAYWRLPIASLPLLERPTITVDASLPGASADTIAPALTSPLERQLGLISGLKEMRASSIYGKCSIMLEFGLDKDIDEAADGAGRHQCRRAVAAEDPAAAADLRQGQPQRLSHHRSGADLGCLRYPGTLSTTPTR